MRDDTVPLSYFEQFYERGPDPWGFATSDYERVKYVETLAALPRDRYRAGFEIGCSIGVLTDLLATRCDRLLAVEPVATALDAARLRNARHAHVTFASMFVPQQWPADVFDLVVLSEVLDYLGRDDLVAVADKLHGTAVGDVVLVHWVGKKRGGPTAAEASEHLIFALSDRFTLARQDRNADYRLDVLSRKT